MECFIVRLSFFEERNVSLAMVFGRWEGAGRVSVFEGLERMEGREEGAVGA
jgi:hypothetical protein